MNKRIKQNFIYPQINDEQRKYGSSILSRPIINILGDYRKLLPPEEEQRRYNVEPSTCFLFAQLHADATYEEAVFSEIDNNYAERFPAQFAGGTETGGDPLKGADVIYDRGSIREESMPFTSDIQSWEEYTSWKGVDKDKVIAEGLADKNLKRRFGVTLFERNTPLETKYVLLEEGLKRGVPCISVWGVQNGDTYATKPDGVSDTHFVECIYLDKVNKQIHILDTYKPFIKILPANYSPDFALLRYVQKKGEFEQEQLNWIEKMLKYIAEALGLIQKQVNELPKPTVTEKPIEPKPISLREELYRVAIDSLGKDVTPDDNVKDEVACVSSLCAILNKVISFPNLTYTPVLLSTLLKDKRFKSTLEPKAGNIVISATETGNGTTRGHCGLHDGNGWIMSNNSNTGIWERNYSIAEWVDRYRTKGGMKVYYFELL